MKQRLRIVLFEWNGIMQRDVKQTLRKMGIVVKTFSYQLTDWVNDDYFYTNFLKCLNEEGCDAVFSMLFFPIIARICHEKHIPYLAWVYDSPFYSPDMESMKYEEAYPFLFDRCQAEQLRDAGYRSFHSPLAVNVDRLDEIHLSEEEKSYYGAEASFVGQLYEREWTNEMTEEEQAYYDTFCERKDIILQLSRECRFKWYSNSYNAKLLPGIDYMGTVMYYSEMPKVFKATAVNLNISLKTIRSGIPLRALDILGAGGFLLSNCQPELEETFRIGEEAEIYHSREELMDKAKYYIGNESERMRIAAQGREAVRNLFSFECRLQEMLGTVDF